MKTVSLDVHAQTSQFLAVSCEGEVILECPVATQREALRDLVGGLPGAKRLIFEEGPLSGLIVDALSDLVDHIVVCDPTRNALISRAEDSTDEQDARRLVVLDRAGALHGVYVPDEPYRTLRSLMQYDRALAVAVTGVKNRIKGLCRVQGIRCRGVGAYGRAARREVWSQLPNAAVRWQMSSLYRRLDQLRRERAGVHRVVGRQAGKLAMIDLLQTVPGIGPITARTLAAWIVDPKRFRNRSALCAYAGLGLRRNVTNWQTVGRVRASHRGQRAIKRVLFLAARSVIGGKTALARRYEARLGSGWADRKAVRDIARCILLTACGVWIHGREYNDALVNVPDAEPRRAGRGPSR